MQQHQTKKIKEITEMDTKTHRNNFGGSVKNYVLIKIESLILGPSEKKFYEEVAITRSQS